MVTITITIHFACFFDIFFSKSVGLLSKPPYIINYGLFLVKNILQSSQPIAIPPKRNAKPNKYSLLIS